MVWKVAEETEKEPGPGRAILRAVFLDSKGVVVFKYVEEIGDSDGEVEDFADRAKAAFGNQQTKMSVKQTVLNKAEGFLNS